GRTSPVRISPRGAEWRPTRRDGPSGATWIGAQALVRPDAAGFRILPPKEPVERRLARGDETTRGSPGEAREVRPVSTSALDTGRRRAQCVLERVWANLPRRLVGQFQGSRDISLRLQEQRHLRQSITHADRLDAGHLYWSSGVRRENQRLVRRQLERL